MKYVVTWKNRQMDTKEAQRLLDVFSKWTPAASNILQFVERVDGTGGMSIVEADNPLDVMRDTSKFAEWLEFDVVPVVDIQDSVPVMTEALDFLHSIP